MSRLATILFCAAAVASAGILDMAVKGTTTDYADFFKNQFSSVQDLIPNTQSDLSLNVNRVKDLLTAVTSKSRILEPLANQGQKNTLNMATSLLREVTNFGNKVGREGEGRFNQNKNMWNSLVNKVFNTSGLLQLLPLLTGGSALPSMAAVLVPITYLLFAY